MIKKGEIKKTLDWANQQYDKNSSPFRATYFSKLAILELAGWVELSQDDLIFRCTKKCLKQPNHLKEMEGFIKKNSGFSSEKHFKNMMKQVFGMRGVEILNRACDRAKIKALYHELDDLWRVRNSLAHTYVNSMTPRVDAPVKTLGRFGAIYEGLKEIEAKCKTCKF